MELFIVHDGGQRVHYSTERLYRYLSELGTDEVINDRAAQTIASLWHSPSEPLSTVLSTMGKVDRRMTRETFASDAEYAAAAPDDRRALDALSAYIVAKIATAPSSIRPCACDDCFDLVVGIIGDLCHACKGAGCTFGEGDSCQRDDAYGADDTPRVEYVGPEWEGDQEPEACCTFRCVNESCPNHHVDYPCTRKYEVPGTYPTEYVCELCAESLDSNN